MPYFFDKNACATCPFDRCIEDRRTKPIPGRRTQFRLKQQAALACTFSDFAPCSISDPDPSRLFSDHLTQFRNNLEYAGKQYFNTSFKVENSAIAKVLGDIYELLISASLWNAASAWNNYMDSNKWASDIFTNPNNSIPCESRKVAILPLPRNYDPTLLFTHENRSSILAFENSLRLKNMELGLSCPDIVGIRLPHPLPDEMHIFLNEISSLNLENQNLLQQAYKVLEGKINNYQFLFAIAVKRTVRSDRLYQPLFEANILKFLIQEILHGSAFRFNVFVESTEGADAESHYRAASLLSLLRGGEPQKAVDKLFIAQCPKETGQSLLEDLPLFPV